MEKVPFINRDEAEPSPRAIRPRSISYDEGNQDEISRVVSVGRSHGTPVFASISP